MTSPVRLTPGDAGASQALIDAYAESWQRINDAQLALPNDPVNARKRARLNELQDMVSREITKLDATARAYVADQFPAVYEGAAERGARAVAADALAFVQPNREAAALLADGLERQLLEATQHVDETTKALIRRIGRDAGLKTALDGNTATQAATEMRRILQESGIHAVTYSNGAKVGLKAYTEMAIRTSTALALNQGALQGAADAGCLYWEIFDGPSCGWTSHRDPNKAHGRIVTREQAQRFPIAHPNCRRAVGPRPDLGMDEKASSVSREPSGGPGGSSGATSTQDSIPGAPAASQGDVPPPRATAATDRIAKAQQRATTSVAERATYRRIGTPEEGDAWLAQHFDPKKLSKDQKFAQGMWTSPLYKNLNEILRTGQTTLRKVKVHQGIHEFPVRLETLAQDITQAESEGYIVSTAHDFQKMLENIGPALEQHRLPENLSLFRVVDLPELRAADPASLIGRTLEDQGYLATSTSPVSAVKVTSEALGVSTDTPVMLEIRAQAGTAFGTPERSMGTVNGVKYGGYTQVQEVVLKPGKFRVVEVVDEVVDTSGYTLKNAKMKRAPNAPGKTVSVRRIVVELLP